MEYICVEVYKLNIYTSKFTINNSNWVSFEPSGEKLTLEVLKVHGKHLHALQGKPYMKTHQGQIALWNENAWRQFHDN